MATQTRISESTHETLSRLARQTGLPRTEILARAVRHYERELFLNRINEGFASLRANPDASKELEAEVKAWEQTLADGLK
ncbi:MAG: ribbon-helix-helix protein, CopG family [Gemmatimonadota bacterium]